MIIIIFLYVTLFFCSRVKYWVILKRDASSDNKAQNMWFLCAPELLTVIQKIAPR